MGVDVMEEGLEEEGGLGGEVGEGGVEVWGDWVRT